MRKVYTLLVLLIAFFCGIEANAQTVKLNIENNAEHVSAFLDSNAFSLVNGENRITGDYSGNQILYLTPNDGYQITLLGASPEGPTTEQVMLPVSWGNSNKTFTAVIEEVNAVPKSKFKFLVGIGSLNPSNVIKELRLGDKYLDAALYDRYTDVEFDPETESTLTLVTKNGYCFDATLDREENGSWNQTNLSYTVSESDPYSYIYTLDLKAGDQVAFNYPVSLKPVNASFTFNFGEVDPDAVIRSFTNGTNDAVEYAEGENEISFIADTQKNFTLSTKGDYIFSTATLNGDAINRVETAGVAGSFTYTFEVKEGDKVVFANPEVHKLAKANFTFKYDGFAYNDVVLQFINSAANLGAVYAAPGTRQIEFEDPVGKTFTIVTKGDHKFDVATVNGVTITPSLYSGLSGYWQYEFEVENGDEVIFEITKVAAKHYINFTYTNEGTEHAVEYVNINYNRVDVSPQIEFNEGDGIEIKIYNSGLVLDEVLINGVAQSINSYGEVIWGGYPAQRPTTDVNVVITAHLPAMVNFTLNVNDASHVMLNNAQYSYQCNDSNKIEVEDGENELELPETNPTLFIRPNNLPSGWLLDVKDENGTSYNIASYGTGVKVYEGMVLTIKSYDPNDLPPFTVYAFASNLESVKSFTDKEGNSWKDQLSEGGYTELEVSATQNPFTVNNAIVYLNDQKQTADFLGRVDVKLSEDDFLMIFGGGNAPEKHTVSIVDDGEVKYSVFKHHRFEAEDPSSIDMYENTQLLIVPAEGNNIVVAPAVAAATLDAREASDIISNEDGSYLVKVNANTKKLSVTKNIENGVAEILDSLDENAVVYNLQGMRVNSDVKNLPAGIYVVNGKKMMISK